MDLQNTKEKIKNISLPSLKKDQNTAEAGKSGISCIEQMKFYSLLKCLYSHTNYFHFFLSFLSYVAGEFRFPSTESDI